MHPKSNKSCEDYKKLTQFISKGEIRDIEIIDSGNGINFLIKKQTFGEKYATLILSFIQTIIDESLKQRQQSSQVNF